MSVVFDLSLCPVFPAGAAAPVPATDADALAGAFRAWLDSIGENEVGTLFRTGTGTEQRRTEQSSTEKSPDLDSETGAPVLSDAPIRWPLQAPPTQPLELITIRLAGQSAIDDEMATEDESGWRSFEIVARDEPAPVAAPIPFVPAEQIAAVVATPRESQPAIATAKPAGPPMPAAPELFEAPAFPVGRPPFGPKPPEAGVEEPVQATERRPVVADRQVRIETPVEVPAELNAPASVPAAFTRMQFAEPPPALRPSLPPAELLDPKWRSAWVEAPAAPAAVPVSGGQSASTNSEPQDQGQPRSFRNLQVPAAVLRLAARDGVQLSRTGGIL